jgi:hypothetical protein
VLPVALDTLLFAVRLEYLLKLGGELELQFVQAYGQCCWSVLLPVLLLLLPMTGIEVRCCCST